MQDDLRPNLGRSWVEKILENELWMRLVKVLGVILLSCGIVLWLWFSSNENRIDDFGTGKATNSKPTNSKENSIDAEIAKQTKSTANVNNAKTEIAVHLTGQVNKPGLYYLQFGERVNDVVEKAGGFSSNADVQKVNLASLLADGQYLYIPSVEENAPRPASQTPSGGGSSNGETQPGSLININFADAEELEKITGVGPSTAKNILKYRDENGPFTSIEDIENVTGIGEAKFASMESEITV